MTTRHPIHPATGLGIAVVVSIGSLIGGAGASAVEPLQPLHVDASPAACVTAYVGQGITLGQAATLCAVSIGVAPNGADLGSDVAGLVGSFPGFANADPGPLNVACAAPGAGTDPRLSETPEEKALREFDEKTRTPPLDPAEAKKYWEQRDKLSAAADSALMARNAAATDVEARTSQAILTSQMLRTLGGRTSTSNDIVVKQPPATDGGTKQQIADVGTTACQAFAAFVGECNLAGWATSPCQMLRNQMSGCADGTIAYTTGEPGAGCPETVDGKTVEQVVHLRCSKIGKVAPGYDPCGSPDTGGGPGLFRLPNGDTCEPNPWSATADGTAHTTGEGCEHKFEATVPEALNQAPSIGTMVVVLGGPGAPSGASGGGRIEPPPGCKTCGF